MSTTAIKLKKSSVSGKVPLTTDIEYGELALNYADGKLYYKNSTNNIRSFLDSTNIISLIDSAYIQARQLNLDSTAVTALIDSAYVQARQITYDFLDSAEAIHLIDSAYVQARQSLAGNLNGNISLNQFDIVDSGNINIIGAIDATDDISTNNNLVSNFSSGQEGGQVQLATSITNNQLVGGYVTIDIFDNKLRIFETGSPNRGAFIDLVQADSNIASNLLAGGGIVEQDVINLVDSAYVNARLDRTLFLDSAEVIALVDSAYIAARQAPFDSSDFNALFALKNTGDLTEGTNKYYTTARADSDAKRAISVTDAGGDGSLTYDNSTGIITYTGPSESEVRAHFTAGLGIKIVSGNISLDSADSAVFAAISVTGNLVVGGNLQVTGTTTTISTQNLSIADNMFYLNQLESAGTPTISVDVGWAANVNDDGSYTHVGLFRDATDNRFKVFGSYTPEPDSALEIDINHGSFTLADFQAATFHGSLSGNATTSTRLANSRNFSITGDVTATAIGFNGDSDVVFSANITAGSIVSADFDSATTLIIYNSAGTPLKTLYSPGS